MDREPGVMRSLDGQFGGMRLWQINRHRVRAGDMRGTHGESVCDLAIVAVR